MCPTHPGLVVQDSQQVHGVILILLSQRAAVKKTKGHFYFPLFQFWLLNNGKDSTTCQSWWWGRWCLCSSAPRRAWSFSCVRARSVSGRTARPAWAESHSDYLQRNTSGTKPLWHKEEDAQLRMDVIVYIFNVLYVNGIQMKGATTNVCSFSRALNASIKTQNFLQMKSSSRASTLNPSQKQRMGNGNPWLHCHFKAPTCIICAV